jgi:hypothetical protein
MKRFIFILFCVFISSNAVAQVQQKNVDLVGKVSLSVDPCNGVHVGGNYAYVLISNNLYIVDISDPKNPTEVNQVKIHNLGQGVVRDFYVTEKYVYIPYNQSGVIIIDVSDPKKAKEVGFYSCHPYGVFVLGKYAYVSDSDGLIILDVSDPKNPKKNGSCMPPEVQWQAWKLYVAGNYAYVINCSIMPTSGLDIIDISDPQNPEFITKHHIKDVPYAIYIVGNYAYVVTIWGGLHIIDISDPKNPKELSNHGEVKFTSDICVAGDYAYVVDDGLRVIDVSNPNKPNEVGFYNPVTHGVTGVDVAGVYAYIVAYRVGGDSVLSIVKYENATHPKISVDPKGKLSTTWGHLKQ